MWKYVYNTWENSQKEFCMNIKFWTVSYLLHQLIKPVGVNVCYRCFSLRRWCSPGHFCQCLETFSMSQLGVGSLLLASSGKRPGVLLNIHQCAGQPLTTKNDVAPTVKNAKAGKLYYRWFTKIFFWFPNNFLRCFIDLGYFATLKLASVF